MFKIKIHSVIDVITNSSTEIYSWYDSSVGACKEMIQEMLKVFGVDKNVDDIFNISVCCEMSEYSEYIYTKDEEEINILLPDYPKEWRERHAYLDSLIQDITTGKIVKPEWMKEAEQKEDANTYRSPSNVFFITTKDPIYEPLAKKIEAFLYSPEHDAEYDG